MHPVLQDFARQFFFALFAACLPAILTTFISQPLILGGHPGEPVAQATLMPRHLT